MFPELKTWFNKTLLGVFGDFVSSDTVESLALPQEERCPLRETVGQLGLLFHKLEASNPLSYNPDDLDNIGGDKGKAAIAAFVNLYRSDGYDRAEMSDYADFIFYEMWGDREGDDPAKFRFRTLVGLLLEHHGHDVNLGPRVIRYEPDQ